MAPSGANLSNIIVACRYYESNENPDYHSISNFSHCSVENTGGVLMNPLDEVMSVTEAAERWGLKPVTVRLACTGYSRAKPRFTDKEARKSGSTWLITRAGMERVYGPADGK